MTGNEDLRRYARNLQSEREAAVLYRIMAEREEHPELAGIYRKMAETEERHADTWRRKIEEAGGTVSPFAPGWRVRLLGWLAKVWGTGLILQSVTAMEGDAGKEYAGQPDPEVPRIAAEERSHARIFRSLSRGSSRGLEGSAVARLEGRHRFTGGNALRAAVMGANDGLVSNLSLVMGVAGAALEGRAILVTGMAGLLAGAISMALGEWLSVQSARELYENQIQIEKEELEESPEEEMEELALIYQAKGLPESQARELARSILADPEGALDTLSREELGIDPQELGGSAWEAALTSFALFAVGAAVPVLPFLFLSGHAAVAASGAFSALGLFVIGAGITLVTGKPLLASGGRQIVFGLGAAVVTYVIGALIGVNLGG